MQKRFIQSMLLLMVLFTVTSCEVIGDIFQAGMGVGIFIVIVVIAVIAFVVSKLGGNK